LAEEKNIEGILAKKTNSIYLTAKRSSEWLKIKTSRRQEAIIGGFTKPKGSRKNFGALVLGVYQGNDFIYIGHTGGGFTEKDLEEIQVLLDKLIIKKSPFKDPPKTNTPVTWVKPKLVCEVNFSEWTQEGLMRHPVFLGLREDKKPEEIIIEKPFIQTDADNPDEPYENQIPGERNEKKNIDKEVLIKGRKLKLTNLNKVFWPEEGYTKGDLIDYYRQVSKFILPYLIDRPESLNRHPNGIDKKNFFQKDMANLPPSWVKTRKIYSESNDKEINYLICNDEATLVYMANLGCIEINPWFSRIKSLDNPDYLVIDLDPVEISFDKVIETAQEVKKVLDFAGAPSYCKTSGATGLHIYVPLNAKYNYDIAKNFAELLCRMVNSRIPEITSVERNPAKRKKKVYLDFLQNRSGQTLAAPYSVRPYPEATVATPLKWEEVKTGLKPENFNIKNIFNRLKVKGDLFKGVLGKGINIEKCIKNLERKKL
jgi:bifunctional non-homologous end joining protein LigD